jgi:hypothetical protein
MLDTPTILPNQNIQESEWLKAKRKDKSANRW